MRREDKIRDLPRPKRNRRCEVDRFKCPNGRPHWLSREFKDFIGNRQYRQARFNTRSHGPQLAKQDIVNLREEANTVDHASNLDERQPAGERLVNLVPPGEDWTIPNQDAKQDA